MENRYSNRPTKRVNVTFLVLMIIFAVGMIAFGTLYFLDSSKTGVYAGGDAVTGAATVILAMGAGRKASRSILESFGVEVK